MELSVAAQPVRACPMRSPSESRPNRPRKREAHSGCCPVRGNGNAGAVSPRRLNALSRNEQIISNAVEADGYPLAAIGHRPNGLMAQAEDHFVLVVEHPTANVFAGLLSFEILQIHAATRRGEERADLRHPINTARN